MIFFNQNLAGKHPSASDGAINLMTSLVTEVHGSKIKKAFEFFQVGSFDLLTFFFQDFLGDNWPARSASRSPTKTGNLFVSFLFRCATASRWFCPPRRVTSASVFFFFCTSGCQNIRTCWFSLGGCWASKTYFWSLLRHHPPFPHQDKSGLINSLLRTQITSKV